MKNIGNNLQPLCIMPNGKLLCYRCGVIYLLDKDIVEKKYLIFRNIRETILGSSRYLFRLLRLGIRTAEPIDNENVIISIGNMLYELNLNEGIISKGYFCGIGIRPLKFTKVLGLNNIQDGIYFGGYLSNSEKKEVKIYRRISIDKWEIVYVFPNGVINHVHTIVSDKYRECLWIFTGDFDESSAIWKVESNFKKVQRVAYNHQKYRGCVAFALPDGLLYATDAPFEDNYIYMMQTNPLVINKITSIHGSCIYGCQWKDKYVFSSTVEGDGRNTSRLEFLFGRKKGIGIKDDYVHIYIGNLVEGFREIYKEKKDFLPYYTFQFGVFKFPSGINNSDTLYFQPVATDKNDLNLMSITEYEVG